MQDGGQLVLENRLVYIGQEKDLAKLVVRKKQGRMRVGDQEGSRAQMKKREDIS